MIGFYSSQWTSPWGASEELWSQAALLGSVAKSFNEKKTR